MLNIGLEMMLHVLDDIPLLETKGNTSIQKSLALILMSVLQLWVRVTRSSRSTCESAP
jgi:hypothetical protein